MWVATTDTSCFAATDEVVGIGEPTDVVADHDPGAARLVEHRGSPRVGRQRDVEPVRAGPRPPGPTDRAPRPRRPRGRGPALTPPMSSRSAPASNELFGRAVTSSSSPYVAPSSKKESGVRLRMPITSVRVERSWTTSPRRYDQCTLAEHTTARSERRTAPATTPPATTAAPAMVRRVERHRHRGRRGRRARAVPARGRASAAGARRRAPARGPHHPRDHAPGETPGRQRPGERHREEVRGQRHQRDRAEHREQHRAPPPAGPRPSSRPTHGATQDHGVGARRAPRAARCPRLAPHERRNPTDRSRNGSTSRSTVAATGEHPDSLCRSAEV